MRSIIGVLLWILWMYAFWKIVFGKDRWSNV